MQVQSTLRIPVRYSYLTPPVIVMVVAKCIGKAPMKNVAEGALNLVIYESDDREYDPEILDMIFNYMYMQYVRHIG